MSSSNLANGSANPTSQAAQASGATPSKGSTSQPYPSATMTPSASNSASTSGTTTLASTTTSSSPRTTTTSIPTTAVQHGISKLSLNREGEGSGATLVAGETGVRGDVVNGQQAGAQEGNGRFIQDPRLDHLVKLVPFPSGTSKLSKD